MKIVTGKVINSAYTQINDLDKDMGLDRDLPQSVWVNGELFEFTWDPEVGRKGAWICVTDFDMSEEFATNENSDETNYCNEDDYDQHL